MRGHPEAAANRQEALGGEGVLALLVEARRSETCAIAEEALKIFRRQDSRPPPGAPARQVPFQPIHAFAERRFATVCSDLARQLCVDDARSHGGEKSENSSELLRDA